MNISEIRTPEVLFKWVEDNSRSHHDFLGFVHAITNFHESLDKNAPGARVRLQVNSGTLIKTTGNATAFFILFTLDDEAETTFTYSIEVDEATGKLGETRYIKPDTPERERVMVH